MRVCRIGRGCCDTTHSTPKLHIVATEYKLKLKITTETVLISCNGIIVWVFKATGNFVTNVKQIKNQSDLISMSSFTGPPHLTIRSSVCMILI